MIEFRKYAEITRRRMFYAMIRVTRCYGGISAFSSPSVRPYNFADRDSNDGSVSRSVHFSIVVQPETFLNQVDGKQEAINRISSINHVREKKIIAE